MLKVCGNTFPDTRNVNDSSNIADIVGVADDRGLTRSQGHSTIQNLSFPVDTSVNSHRRVTTQKLILILSPASYAPY